MTNELLTAIAKGIESGIDYDDAAQAACSAIYGAGYSIIPLSELAALAMLSDNLDAPPDVLNVVGEAVERLMGSLA